MHEDHCTHNLLGDHRRHRISSSWGKRKLSKNQLLTLDIEAVRGRLGDNADDNMGSAALTFCSWSIQLYLREDIYDNVQSAALACCGWSILAHFRVWLGVGSVGPCL
jgi:hypothetical protein